MNEEYLFQFFVGVNKFINMSYFLNKCDIGKGNFSSYLKYHAKTVSIEKLNNLYYEILVSFQSFDEFRKHV